MHQPFTAERAGRGRLHRSGRPGRGERAVQVWLPGPERAVLVGLLEQLEELLDDGSDAAGTGPRDPLEALTGMVGHDVPPRTPQDPALARLLPEGNRDDPDLAAEYRRLTEYDLRTRKRAAARTAAEALRRPEPVRLEPDEAVALLRAMTDLRLVLGERLELHTDIDAELLHHRLHGLLPVDGPDPQEWVRSATVYEVLTGWQESLVAAVTKVGS